MRLSQEDLCQALSLPASLKYQSEGGPGIKDIMHLLQGASDPQGNRDIFFQSQICFWLLAAIDGHAKNFSIFLRPREQFALTPLYDILSAHPLMEKRGVER